MNDEGGALTHGQTVRNDENGVRLLRVSRRFGMRFDGVTRSHRRKQAVWSGHRAAFLLPFRHF